MNTIYKNEDLAVFYKVAIKIIFKDTIEITFTAQLDIDRSIKTPMNIA